MFERIVVVVDGSPTSSYAVGASLTLAREDRSPLIFCVTVDPELCPEREMAAFGEIAMGRSQQLLDDALARAREAGITDASGVVVRDEAGHGVVALARERGAGLIALGIEPRVGFLRPFMRTLAHEILRHTTIPLCVMRRPAVGRLSHRILVPIVDDALSRVAIAYARELARNFDSTLLFCTLDESVATRDAALALIDGARDETLAAGLRAEAFLLPPQRSVSQTIAQNATIHGCDAIVMATHLREGFKFLVEGSVTQAVVYSSNVPVVVVRSPELPPPA